MDASIWVGWIGVSLGVGTVARLWKRRSWLLWAAVAAALYAMFEDPPLADMLSRPRFPPGRRQLIDTGLGVLIVGGGLTGLLAMLPRIGGRRRRRRRSRSKLPALAVGEEAKQCPSCVEAVSAKAELCPFCGHRFTVEPASH